MGKVIKVTAKEFRTYGNRQIVDEYDDEFEEYVGELNYWNRLRAYRKFIRSMETEIWYITADEGGMDVDKNGNS